LNPNRTTLVLGDVAETAITYPIPAALGFIAYDLDLYSSTREALKILTRADVPRLRRVALYFDDLAEHYNHAWGGEPLAIDEFNTSSTTVKIDVWRGVQDRPFHDSRWVRGMYVAHDLEAISAVRLARPPARMR
jgi:hypothetical protein